jgi:hypothetical protein
MNVDGMNYDPDNLPMRNHESTLQQAKAIEDERQLGQRERLRKETGMRIIFHSMSLC